MFKKNDSMVNVDFDPLKGLILRWKLNGNLNNIYLHHVIILDVKNLNDYQLSIQQYFSKIKLGDIISIAFIDQYDQTYILNWKQKCSMSQWNLHKVKPTLSKLSDLYQIMLLIADRIKQFQQPTFISIFTQKTGQQLDSLIKYSNKFITNKQRVFINIFAQIETYIKFTNGIYLFDLNDLQEESFWNFLRSFFYQIALIKVKISIVCQNGCICSQDQSLWKNTQFNRIQRQLKGPTISYQNDTIYFVNQQTTQKINYKLNITLEWKDINSNQYRSSKSIQINTISQKIYQRTYGNRQMQYGIELAPGIFSKISPYRSQSLIWFKKDSILENI